MQNKTQRYILPLAIITALFFMWGFITNLNDILIPHLKRACELNDFQSAFVQFAFFLAYFLMSIPAAYVLKKTGYKNGIVIGLLVSCTGALLFLPAATTRVYVYFLFALSILAAGITLLQVAANPYVSVLGDPTKAASRLSLVGAFNSLGASIGPLIGGMLILSDFKYTPAELNAMPIIEKETILNMEAASVQGPYMVLAGLLLLLAIVIYFSKLPDISEPAEATHNRRLSIFSHPKLLLGVIAIFVYVGAEVCIGSFIIRYGESLNISGFTVKGGATYVFYYMISAMVGRFLGIFYLPKVKPSLALIVKCGLAILLIGLSFATTGLVALWCVVLIGFCNSIMWPIIFPMAIEGLGDYTKKGSSYLIMGVVGGAIVPLVFGLVSDRVSTQTAFLIPALCYLFILYYGIWGSKQARQLVPTGVVGN